MKYNRTLVHVCALGESEENDTVPLHAPVAQWIEQRFSNSQKILCMSGLQMKEIL